MNNQQLEQYFYKNYISLIAKHNITSIEQFKNLISEPPKGMLQFSRPTCDGDERANLHYEGGPLFKLWSSGNVIELEVEYYLGFNFETGRWAFIDNVLDEEDGFYNNINKEDVEIYNMRGKNAKLI